jgi:hypothetical protein
MGQLEVEVLFVVSFAVEGEHSVVELFGEAIAEIPALEAGALLEVEVEFGLAVY